MDVMAVLANFMKIAASPGGLAALERLFTDHGLTADKVEAAAKNMPDTPDPKKE